MSFGKRLLLFFLSFVLSLPAHGQAPTHVDLLLQTRSLDLTQERSSEIVSQYKPGLTDFKASIHWPVNAEIEAQQWLREQSPQSQKLDPQLLSNFFNRLLYILRLGQNGHLTIIKLEVDFLADDILRISQDIHRRSNLPAEQKPQLMSEVLIATTQWALAALGNLNLSEKRRVNEVLSYLVREGLNSTLIQARISKAQEYNIIFRITQATAALLVAYGLHAAPEALGLVETQRWLESQLQPYAIQKIPVGLIMFFGALLLNPNPKWISKKRAQVTSAIRSLNKEIAPASGANYTFNKSDRKNNEPSRWPPQNEAFKFSIENVKSLLKGQPDEKILGLLLNPEDQLDPEIYKNTLQNQPQLTNAETEGLQVREQFLTALVETFGSEKTLWALDTEKASLQWLKKLMVVQPERQLQQMSFLQAQKIALLEVQQKFGYTEGTSITEIENSKYMDSRAFSALNHFNQRMNQLQDREIYRTQNSAVDLEKIKQSLIDELHNLRKKNWEHALNYASFINPREKVHFSNYGLIQISDLANARLQFKSVSQTPRHQVAGLNVWRLSTDNLDVFVPQYSLGSSVLTLANGQQIEISDQDISRLLFLLINHYKKSLKLPGLQLFHLEAYNRDEQIVRVIQQLIETQDPDLKSLINRFSQSIKNRSFEGYLSMSLTDRLRESQFLQIKTKPLEAFFWWGLKKNKNFWNNTENYLKKNSKYFSTNFPQKNAHAVSLRQFLNRISLDFIKTLAVVTTLAIASPHADRIYETQVKPHLSNIDLVTIFNSSLEKVSEYGDRIGLDKLGEALGRDGSDRKSSAPSDGESSKKSKDQRAESDTLRMDESMNSYITSPDEGAEAKGKELFSIIPNRIRLSEIPVYMNLITEKQMPKNMKYEKYPKDTFEFQYVKNDTSQNYDFAIQGHKYQEAKSGMLAILSPSGYQPIHIELSYQMSPGGESFTYWQTDFQIYTSAKNGMSFIKFRHTPSSDHKFKVKAYYKKIQLHDSQYILSQKLPAEGLKSIARRLKSTGASQLSQVFDLHASTSTTFDLQSLERSVKASGLYTYAPEKKGIPETKDPLSFYSRFLNQGVFYYQCSGSNRLFSDILNIYFKDQKLPLESQNVIGFVRKGNQIYENLGHMHVVVIPKGKRFSYIELDATPKNMDPRFKDHMDFGTPGAFQEEEKRQELKKRQKENPISVSRQQPVMRTRENLELIIDSPAIEVDLSKSLQEVLDKIRQIREKIQKYSQSLSAQQKQNPVPILHSLPILMEIFSSGEVTEISIKNLILIEQKLIILGRQDPTAHEFALVEARKLINEKGSHTMALVSVLESLQKQTQVQLALVESGKLKNIDLLRIPSVRAEMQNLLSLVQNALSIFQQLSDGAYTEDRAVKSCRQAVGG